MVDPTVPIAFLAGLVSFLSPCVLPLVPGYLSYMSGVTEPAAARWSRVLPVAAAFVAGFTGVFVVIGTSVGAFSATVFEVSDRSVSLQTLLIRIGGVFIILLGLVFMGAIKIPWLYRERRFHPRPEAGLWGSVFLGGTFAFGWSPCIGPTMGAVLTMAAGNSIRGGPGEGAFLLGIYSLGLGVPFILAGLGMSRLTGVVSWLRGHVQAVNVVSGVLLVVVGLLFVTDQLFRLSVWMQQAATDLDIDFWSEI